MKLNFRTVYQFCPAYSPAHPCALQQLELPDWCQWNSI